MLSKLITRTTLWRIINFLVAHEEESLSGIAIKTKTTKANTFYALKNLESLDIVRKKIIGKTHIYRFNFLNPEASSILKIIESERRQGYNKKMDNLPIIIHSFLEESLKENYHGCIFFGSSLEHQYKDIDLFIILKDKNKSEEIEKKLKLIDENISPLFGAEKEIKDGIKNQDMLYKNVINGITFGFDAIPIRHMSIFLRKKDIKERFVIGYREVLSCMEFEDKEYTKLNLEKGLMNFVYSILNYFDLYPSNDKEAIALFKYKINKSLPLNINETISLMEKYAWVIG